MPTFGPWVQPATVNGSVNTAAFLLSRQGTAFGDTCPIVYVTPATTPPTRTAATLAAEEAAVRSLIDGHADERTLSGSGVPGGITTQIVGDIVGADFNPQASTLVMPLDFRSIETQLLQPSPATWPAGAIGVESESTKGVVSNLRFDYQWRIVLTDNNSQTPTVTSGIVAFQPVPVVDGAGALVHPWHTPAEILALPVLSSLAATSVSQATFSGFRRLLPAPPVSGWAVVAFATTLMRDGTVYDSESAIGIVSPGDSTSGVTFGALYDYLAPRYRFLYATAPPLRQFQRNDGLGLSAPRQINRSSQQRSVRQGPRTYR